MNQIEMREDREQKALARLPDYMRHSIKAYIEQHRPVGGFLQSVISNDLVGAYSRADSTNQHIIRDYVLYFYNHAPAGCWGSPEAYQRWIARSPGEEGGPDA